MDQLSFLENASASYDEVAQNGGPSSPLKWDPATIGRAARVQSNIYDHQSGQVMRDVSNIIYEIHADGRPPACAFLVRRKIKKCIFGVVKSCTVLKLRPDDTNGVPWETTNEKAAVKIMAWELIHRLRHIENPLDEVAAMQQVGNHPHVMGILSLMQDDDYLMLFMPYCSSGDLFSFVAEAGRLSEPNGRYWFRQILQGLGHLQRRGICHRDMSLENILVDQSSGSVLLVIDFGMCLRVPFASEHEGGPPTDVSHGTLRQLIRPLLACGKPNYISPEIMLSEKPFDGFSIDLFAAGVILFIMLVGLPPWEVPNGTDPRFFTICQQQEPGRLLKMVTKWRRDISPEAADLLERMLQEDPRQRLSLCEVLDHPWVLDERVDGNEPMEEEGWRF